MQKISVKTMTQVGIMTAAICIVSPFTIPLPFSPVPLSLCLFVIFLAQYVLGQKGGLLATLLYLLIGLCGIPVFSGFSGGAGKLFGPTGGYLIGYLFMAGVAGFFIEMRQKSIFPALLGMALGIAVLYVFGTLWLLYQSSLSLKAALYAAVLPFLPLDIVKIILAALIGPILRKRCRAL